IGYRAVYRPRVRTLGIVHGGALRARPDVSWEPLLAAVAAALRAGKASVASFHRLDTASDLARRVRAAWGRAWRSESAEPSPHWRVPLPATYDELLQRVSSSTRKQYRKHWRRLEQEFPGRARLRRTTDAQDVPDLARRAESVARGTYQRGLRSGFVHDAENEERLALAARRGRLRAYELEVDGRVWAFEMCERVGDVLYMEFTGYDTSMSRYEPGWIVILEAIQDAIREGAAAIDWGFGDAAYKRRFGAVKADETDVVLFAPRATGLWLRGMRGAI